MALGAMKLPNLIEEASETHPGLAEIEAKLDRISEQVDSCLACLSERHEATRLQRPSWRSMTSDHHSSVLPTGSTSHVEPSDDSIGRPKPRRPSNFSLSSWARPPSKATSSRWLNTARVGSKDVSLRGGRRIQRSVAMDLQAAWQMQAKTMTQDISAPPLMRLNRDRSRADNLWELLDDPDSSRPAYWISQFLKVSVIVGLIISQAQTGEEPVISAHLAAAVETTFDVVFFVEFVCRITTAPSKRSYVLDPLNWADLFSAADLPLRASVGFLVYPALQEKRNVQLILLLFLPILRFLKLLRYFETFRLLIHAARNAMAALPVLFYIMVVITLVVPT
eukprot:s4481_g2.t1